MNADGQEFACSFCPKKFVGLPYMRKHALRYHKAEMNDGEGYDYDSSNI